MIKFVEFSLKQKQILTWWCKDSPYKNYHGIVADGSIRAGKTVSMGLSFFLWSMNTFNQQNFALCGKTVGSFKRNVWKWLHKVLLIRGYRVHEVKTENYISASKGDITNYYYIFGGKDESSQDLVQGITLAGCFLDEVALMPESFVNQVTGRCSLAGAKFWFNCNPEHPLHPFKINWIDKAEDKKLLHLHFEMDDNPSLSDEIKDKYKSLYRGVFYKRFILGLWEVAEGAIYKDSYSDDLLFTDDDIPINARNNNAYRRYIFVDYGTVNPCVFLDVIDDKKTLWIVNEYYYNSRDEKNNGREKTDEELADDMVKFIGKWELKPRSIIIDPSAASFKAALRTKRLRVIEFETDVVSANNKVLDGIRRVATSLVKKLIRIHRDNCKMTQLELKSYVWDEKAIEKGMPERPLKINDHCIAGNTIINTIDSDLKISDLVDKTGLVFCYDEKNKTKAVSKFFDVRKTQENVDVFAIELEDGTIVEATFNHLFLTSKGWIEAGKLSIDDEIIKIDI